MYIYIYIIYVYRYRDACDWLQPTGTATGRPLAWHWAIGAPHCPYAPACLPVMRLLDLIPAKSQEPLRCPRQLHPQENVAVDAPRNRSLVRRPIEAAPLEHSVGPARRCGLSDCQEYREYREYRECPEHRSSDTRPGLLRCGRMAPAYLYSLNGRRQTQGPLVRTPQSPSLRVSRPIGRRASPSARARHAWAWSRQRFHRRLPMVRPTRTTLACTAATIRCSICRCRSPLPTPLSLRPYSLRPSPYSPLSSPYSSQTPLRSRGALIVSMAMLRAAVRPRPGAPVDSSPAAASRAMFVPRCPLHSTPAALRLRSSAGGGRRRIC
jgi:hypothetical protein